MGLADQQVLRRFFNAGSRGRSSNIFPKTQTPLLLILPFYFRRNRLCRLARAVSLTDLKPQGLPTNAKLRDNLPRKSLNFPLVRPQHSQTASRGLQGSGRFCSPTCCLTPPKARAALVTGDDRSQSLVMSYPLPLTSRVATALIRPWFRPETRPNPENAGSYESKKPHGQINVPHPVHSLCVSIRFFSFGKKPLEDFFPNPAYLDPGHPSVAKVQQGPKRPFSTLTLF